MARAIVRQRRQITLPAEICRELGIKTGDAFELEVDNGTLRGTPARQRALDALAAIQAAFQASGIREEEFQADLRRIRREMNREQYGIDEG